MSPSRPRRALPLLAVVARPGCAFPLRGRAHGSAAAPGSRSSSGSAASVPPVSHTPDRPATRTDSVRTTTAALHNTGSFCATSSQAGTSRQERHTDGRFGLDFDRFGQKIQIAAP